MNDNTEKAHRNQNSDPKKQRLLSDPSFEVLVKLQKEIENETGWQPSLKKLVNALVTEQTCAALKKIMMGEFRKKEDREKPTS